MCFAWESLSNSQCTLRARASSWMVSKVVSSPTPWCRCMVASAWASLTAPVGVVPCPVMFPFPSKTPSSPRIWIPAPLFLMLGGAVVLNPQQTMWSFPGHRRRTENQPHTTLVSNSPKDKTSPVVFGSNATGLTCQQFLPLHPGGRTWYDAPLIFTLRPNTFTMGALSAPLLVPEATYSRLYLVWFSTLTTEHTKRLKVSCITF